MSKSSKTKNTEQRETFKSNTWMGIPYNWTWPGKDAVTNNMWDTSANADMFPPKIWGAGWSFNFGYPLIKTKPLSHRILAFILGLILILVIMYAIIVIAMLVYFLLTPASSMQTNVVEVVLQ